MAPGEVNEDVLQAGLACGEVSQLRAALLQRREQGRDSFVRLAHTQHNTAILFMYVLDAGQMFPGFVRARTVSYISGAAELPVASNSTIWWPPNRSISSDGVPEAIRRPWSIIAMRSHTRSASSI